MQQWLRFRLLRLGEKILSSRFSWILAPLSWIWEKIVDIRNALYDKGFLSTHHVRIPVISVGNISVGGTGKTPLVICLAKRFASKRVAIISRGYMSAGNVLSDEMQVIARHIPGALLYQGSDRVALAKRAEQDGAEWILLDDGFQHRRLHRDVDLVIERPEDLLDYVMPRGRLREGIKHLARAVPVRIETKTIRIVDRYGKTVPSIAGERVALFCGIGRPFRFKETIFALGARVVAETYLGDHEPFQDVEKFFNSLDVKYLVCTEKDFVKLPILDLPILWVEIEAEISETVIEKINDKLNN